MIIKSGKTCTVDQLGRIVIPKPLREKMNLKEHDNFEIFIDTNKKNTKKLILKKVKNKCEICASGKNIKEIEGFIVCENCAEKIKNNFE